ncbi:hypothetical protein FQZ97_1136500 [compost metagenome]
MAPENSRSTSMMAEVYTSTQPPCKPSFSISTSMRLEIQLSVPSSVMARGIMISSRIINMGCPQLFT